MFEYIKTHRLGVSIAVLAVFFLSASLLTLSLTPQASEVACNPTPVATSVVNPNPGGNATSLPSATPVPALGITMTADAHFITGTISGGSGSYMITVTDNGATVGTVVPNGTTYTLAWNPAEGTHELGGKVTDRVTGQTAMTSASYTVTPSATPGASASPKPSSPTPKQPSPKPNPSTSATPVSWLRAIITPAYATCGTTQTGTTVGTTQQGTQPVSQPVTNQNPATGTTITNPSPTTQQNTGTTTTTNQTVPTATPTTSPAESGTTTGGTTTTTINPTGSGETEPSNPQVNGSPADEAILPSSPTKICETPQPPLSVFEQLTAWLHPTKCYDIPELTSNPQPSASPQSSVNNSCSIENTLTPEQAHDLFQQQFDNATAQVPVSYAYAATAQPTLSPLEKACANFNQSLATRTGCEKEYAAFKAVDISERKAESDLRAARAKVSDLQNRALYEAQLAQSLVAVNPNLAEKHLKKAEALQQQLDQAKKEVDELSKILDKLVALSITSFNVVEKCELLQAHASDSYISQVLAFAMTFVPETEITKVPGLCKVAEKLGSVGESLAQRFTVCRVVSGIVKGNYLVEILEKYFGFKLVKTISYANKPGLIVNYVLENAETGKTITIRAGQITEAQLEAYLSQLGITMNDYFEASHKDILQLIEQINKLLGK